MHFLINTSRLIIPHPIKCCITAQKHSRQQPVTLQQDLQDLTVDFNVALFTTITLQCSGNFYCSVESCTVEATLTVTPLSFFFFFFLLGLYFRSCGPSPHHVQGPTPALRPAPPARAAADWVLKPLPPAWEGGMKEEQPEEMPVNMARASRLRSNDDCRIQTWVLLVMRWQPPPTLFHIYCLFTPVIKATFAVNYEFHYCIETCLVFFFTFCFFEFSPSLWPRQHFSHVPVGGACLEKAELSQSAQSTELWGKWRVVRGWSLRLIIRCFYDELLTFPSDLNKRGKDWGFLQAPVGRPHCCSGHCSNQ